MVFPRNLSYFTGIGPIPQESVVLRKYRSYSPRNGPIPEGFLQFQRIGRVPEGFVIHKGIGFSPIDCFYLRRMVYSPRIGRIRIGRIPQGLVAVFRGDWSYSLSIDPNRQRLVPFPWDWSKTQRLVHTPRIGRIPPALVASSRGKITHIYIYIYI